MKKRPEYNLSATGRNLRRLREEKKLSVEEVRRYMKLESVQAIYRWELGYNFPAADNLLALAELYEVNPAKMLIRKVCCQKQEKRAVLLYTQDMDYLVYV